MKTYISNLIIPILLIFTTNSCKKFVTVDSPVTSVNEGNAYNNDLTAASVLTGIYTRMSQGFTTNNITSLSLYPELSADNLVPYFANDINYNNYYKNQLTSQISGSNVHLWSQFYPLIYTTNAAIEGITKSELLSLAARQQLLGEAKFIRALLYFYLINLYGDVPLALSTEYKVNAVMPRTPYIEVYDQMILDLKDAIELLKETYTGSNGTSISTERIRPNRYAAQGLLARIYLYRQDFANAEIYSTKVIQNNIMYDTVPLPNVFLKNSKESIWQLQPVRTGENTYEGIFFTITSGGPNTAHPVYLSNDLINNFENSDQRKTIWTSSVVTTQGTFYYPSKYKVFQISTASNPIPVTEYSMVMRLAEQYLIRAEARVEQNNFPGAREDINVIRKRAGLQNTTASTKQTLLDLILKERRFEFFTEMGHRWLDLKRTDNLTKVMNQITAIKGGVWDTNWQYYPIPLSEIQANSNLVQNQGY